MTKYKYKKKWIDKNGRVSVDIYLLLLIGLCLILTSSYITYQWATRKTQIERQEETMEEREMIFHDYNMKSLKWNEHFVRYEDDRYQSVQGIDVSEFQKEIDWQKVKEAGVEFAIIRVGYRGYTEGALMKDYRFEENIQGAIDAGLKVGVYFFSQAISLEEAREEADFVLNQIRPYQIDMPVVFDMEDNGQGTSRINAISSLERTKVAATWLHRIRNAGYTVAYYGSTNTLPRLFQLAYLQEFYCWLAEYGQQPHYQYAYQMWQYSGSGVVDGIETMVDLNILFVPKGQSLWGFSR